jgi:hypothetical protein
MSSPSASRRSRMCSWDLSNMPTGDWHCLHSLGLGPRIELYRILRRNRTSR